MKPNTVLLAVVIGVAIATYVATTTQATYASSLALEAPPLPSLALNGSELNLTGDDSDRDISIDPLEPLPANGTVSISTAGATDLDINDFPPMGVAVIIQNDTIMITNHTFTLGTPLDVEAETNGDGDGDSDDEE